MASQHRNPAILTITWLSPIVLIAAVLVGRFWLGSSATAADTQDVAATATRQAEIAEVSELQTEVAELRTQVAVLKHATPTPSPSPTPTATPVPPKAMNEPLPYVGDWTVSVTSVDKMPTVTGSNQSKTAQGIYVVVRLKATNNGTERRRFPFQDFILVDDNGRVFDPANFESILVSGNLQSISPSIPTDTAVVYDVTTDVGNRFVLESRKDPTFRVQVEIVLRG
jgi:hypothetical protein